VVNRENRGKRIENREQKTEKIETKESREQRTENREQRKKRTERLLLKTNRENLDGTALILDRVITLCWRYQNLTYPQKKRTA